MALFATVGCSLPRDVLSPSGGFDAGFPDVGGGGHDAGIPPADTGHAIDGGTPRDVGPLVDANVDGGPSACTTSCDDGNPCTTDTCDATGTCTHTNAAGSCDDSVLCNGADTCSAGTCSVHDGIDPCPGASHCDPATDTCTGCATSSDCPAATTSDWSTCDFGGDLCASTGGSQMRTITSYSCDRGTCAASTTSEMQSCTRPSTDGTMCAAVTFGDWSACDFGTDPCTQAGTQARIVTSSHCAAGACVATDASESQSCTRTTDAMPCGMVTVSDWSACMVGSTCATTGTQTRTTTTPACSGGACMIVTATESAACTPASVIGATCGTATCSPWGTCAQTMPGSCDRTGTQSRSCSTPTCTGSGCSGSSTTMETQACSADVSGVSCSTESCGPCREPGRLDCRHGHSGSMRCTTTNGTCMDYGLGPFCGGLPTYSSVSCSCP